MAIEFPESSKFHLFSVVGEVLAYESRSQTQVYGGGTGIGGVNNAIQSQTDNYQHIWLGLDDGREIEINTVNCRVPARPGSWISVISSYYKNKDTGFSIAYYNHSTRDIVHDDLLERQVAYESLPASRRGGTYMKLVWACVLWIPSALITYPQTSRRQKQLRDYIEKAVRTSNTEIPEKPVNVISASNPPYAHA